MLTMYSSKESPLRVCLIDNDSVLQEFERSVLTCLIILVRNHYFVSLIMKPEFIILSSDEKLHFTKAYNYVLYLPLNN